MADFSWDIKQFKDAKELEAYLSTLTPWAKGLVVHHTVSPLPRDWKGKRTMENIGNFYKETNKWPSGPHLFIAPDGIWQGTPITEIGVHAGVCNTTMIGMEVVGLYDKHAWEEPIKTFAEETILVVLKWLKIQNVNKVTLKGHRECSSPKTCPGSAIDMNVLRQTIQGRLVETLNVNNAKQIQVMGVEADITKEQWISFLKRNGAVNPGMLSEKEAERIYQLLSWLEISPSFFGALMIELTGRPIYYKKLSDKNSFFLTLFSFIIDMKDKCEDVNVTDAYNVVRVFFPNDYAYHINPIVENQKYIQTH